MVIAVHGGAGSPRSGKVREEDACHEGLRGALEAGRAVLEGGGGALDAVQAAVAALEDFPLFNAGRGAVPAADGGYELDACVMDGASGRAGACANVSGVRHPVELARVVMEETRHVLLVGEGAEALADEHGLERAPREWFETRVKGTDHGTVGAVARDAAGNLAAATSTGGVRGQLGGRVGDAPLVGSGTYAANGVCAVSCTGIGETFIRAVAAHEVASLVRHAGLGLEEATGAVLARVEGGLIAVGAGGEVAMPFNTAIMHRGVWREGAEMATAIRANIRAL